MPQWSSLLLNFYNPSLILYSNILTGYSGWSFRSAIQIDHLDWPYRLFGLAIRVDYSDWPLESSDHSDWTFELIIRVTRTTRTGWFRASIHHHTKSTHSTQSLKLKNLNWRISIEESQFRPHLRRPPWPLSATIPNNPQIRNLNICI